MISEIEHISIRAKYAIVPSLDRACMYVSRANPSEILVWMSELVCVFMIVVLTSKDRGSKLTM